MTNQKPQHCEGCHHLCNSGEGTLRFLSRYEESGWCGDYDDGLEGRWLVRCLDSATCAVRKNDFAIRCEIAERANANTAEARTRRDTIAAALAELRILVTNRESLYARRPGGRFSDLLVLYTGSTTGCLQPVPYSVDRYCATGEGDPRRIAAEVDQQYAPRRPQPLLYDESSQPEYD